MTSLDDSDEDYLDDPIQLIDFEQKRISNQFDKTNPEEYDQADSEGELFILKTKKNLEKNCFKNQSATTTITLPVTFFDIVQNVQYLNDCRPFFVKIVDCDKHPWYYKKYLRSDKKRDDELIDVGVEDYLQPNRNKNNGLNSSVDSEDNMHNQQSKPKIRPVETPYEGLKNSNTMAEPVSPKPDKPLHDWQKIIKQKAIGQKNDLQVNFRKNLGLIGLKISHTTETIKTSKKKHKRSKTDKHKLKTKNSDAKSKKIKKRTYTKRVNSNILKDINNAKTSPLVKQDNELSPVKSVPSNFIKQQNNEVLPVKSTPPNLTKHPGSRHASIAKKEPASTPKISDRLNLTSSGSVTLGTLPENVVNPAKSVPTEIRKTALSDNLSKNVFTVCPCKISQSSDNIPASSESTSMSPSTNVPTSLPKQPGLSVTSSKNMLTNLPKTLESPCKLSPSYRIPCSSASTSVLKFQQNVNASPATSVPTSLPKLPGLTVTPSKNVLTNLPKLSERVNDTPVKNASSAGLTRLPDSMRVTDNTNHNNYNLVQSHFYTEEQSEEQKITHIEGTLKRYNEVQRPKFITDSNSNEKNKTIISLLNKKVLNYDNTDQYQPTDMNAQKEHKSDKTKKSIMKKEAEMSNPSGDKKNKDILNMKIFKPQKKDNKNKITRLTKTFLKEKKNKQGTRFIKAKESSLNGASEKIKSAHRCNAAISEHAKLQNERRQKLTVEPAKKPTHTADDHDKKINLLSSNVVNKAVIEDIIAKCKNNKMAMIKKNSSQLNFASPSSSFAQNCISQNPSAQPRMVAPALQVDQNAVNFESQKTTNFITSPPSSFQIQREHMPAILNDLRGPWVPTSQMSSIVNNSVINNNIKMSQNTYNGQKTSKISCINVTISTSPCVSQASLHSTTAQMSMNTNTKLLDTGEVATITNGQQRQSLQSTLTMKMGENIKIPCHVNVPPQIKENNKMIAVRRKSVSSVGENKLLEVCNNLMRLAKNDDSDKVTPQRMFRPASTLNSPAPSANFEPCNPNSSYQQYYPLQTLVSPRINLQDNLQTGVNQGASHLQHSQMLSNLNAAAQQIMPRQKNSQQCYLGKVSALQQSRRALLTTSRLSAMPNTQPIVQPTAEKKPDELGHTLWLGDPRQQAIQRQLPPTCDVAPPHMGNNPQHRNESLHPQTSLKPPNFNMPPPNIPAKQVPKQGMVPQPIPVLQRDIQPGCRPVMYQHFLPNDFTAGVRNNQPLEHQAYPKQFVQQNRGIDYSNGRHYFPVYVGVPQNLPMNTVPYEMQNAWNCYYPNMTIPPPPPLFPPQHNMEQSNGYRFIDSNQAHNQLPQKSVTGTTVIGCNDTGLVRKINIHSAAVDTNDKQDPMNEVICNDNKAVTLGSDTEKPVASKKEMMEELSRVTAIISPPRSPIRDRVALKYCTEKVQIQNYSVRDSSPSIREDKNPNISTVKDNLQTKNVSPKNVRSPKTSSLKRTTSESNFPTTSVTDNIVCKDFSINKSPKHSSKENTSLTLKSTPSSSTLEREKSTEPVLMNQAGVLVTKSSKPTSTSSSSSNIEKSVNNNILTSSTISHNENFKRPHLQMDNISETVTSQTLIKRPKPSPLSRKPRFDSVLNTQMSVDTNPIALKGYSPPILPIPSYTKSLEILAKSNLESERRNPVDFAENQFKEPILINAVGIPQPTATGSKKILTEEQKEQQEKAVKKISLDEYKKRVSQSDGNKEDVRSFNVDKIKIKNENPDQDLGYDSDSTMKM